MKCRLCAKECKNDHHWSASFRNPWLKELIKATAATFDYVHVDGVKFMGDPKGGDA